MVPVTERLWTLGLRKWRIIYMPPRLDGIQPWSLPSPTWKAMPPHGGGQWDKRKGRTMATLGSFSRNVSRPNLSQGTLITSWGVNFVTLWMPQMKTWGNMWGLIPNSCLRSDTCMSWTMCADSWWDFQLGPNKSLRKVGPPHYLKPSWKWRAFRMWGGVKNLGSRRTTSSFTRSQGMMENGIVGKEAQQRINPNNSKAWGLNPRGTLWRRGLLSKGANPRETLGWNPKQRASIVTRWGITPRIIPSPKWGMGVLR